MSLSSNGTSQLEALYIRTLGNIQGNSLNEILFYCFTKKPPSTTLLLVIYKKFDTTSKKLLLENCLSICSWYGSPRLVKLIFMFFLCSICIKIIKIQPLSRRLDWSWKRITKSPFRLLNLELGKELWSCKLYLHLTCSLSLTNKTKKKGYT